MMALLISVIFPALLVMAAVNDFRFYKIPNNISGLLVVSWPFAALFFGMGLQDMAMSAGVAALVLVAGFILFAFKVMGAGDSKLIAASSLWVGVAQLPMFVLTFAVAGGFLALFIMSFRRMPLPVMIATHSWIDGLYNRKQVMPYGIAIAIGGIIVWPETPFFAFG
ncbi:prepilin peptidase [Parvularcula sp. LCG005]|uniref:A24 family peptidase n=1 Tax=Parvularcula sp. LCG005 TaxID=3078805 RepID=UPI002941FA1C|nr:prepilin peptidase [Parvularcula sp. LCG005]WOI53561.1 prepilin peptidase [Parvularcula sp. LCG005]